MGAPGPVAQLNIGRARYDLDDPRMADFMNNLDLVNRIAERAPGFVWRMQDESGNATNIKLDNDPRFISNMSVWESADALRAFVFDTLHKRFLARNDEWFETPTQAHFVIWPVAAGHRPDLAEGLARLAQLEREGDSAQAYGWGFI